MIDSGLYVGLMSGTSLDAVDAVVVRFSAGRFEVLGADTVPIPEALYRELVALQRPDADELARAALTANRLADLYAEAAFGALRRSGRRAADVVAIGCHGQTVRHRPDLGYTVQLANPARLAELVGIDVVADFRSRDVAAGGQGAPLVPAFHARAFARNGVHRVVVNIGGIANVTDLPPAGAVRGWDTGPGNVLLDGWARRHLGAPFDRDGRFAQSGRVDADLLAAMLRESYFTVAPPKSTGRDLFDVQWLAQFDTGQRSPADVQATLTALTAETIAAAIEQECAAASSVLVGGGGAYNATLMSLLATRLAPRTVQTTDEVGVPAGLVEPIAFAWLAERCVAREPANLTDVTGARGRRVLGALWPR